MSNANEVYLGLEFLQSQLGSDSTLASLAPGGVWLNEAPPDSAIPFVTKAEQSGGNDTLTMNKVRVLSNPLFQIRVSGPALMAGQIADAAARIDALLGGDDGLKNQTVIGGIIEACYRESPLALGDIVNGEQWLILGGLWRMQIKHT